MVVQMVMEDVGLREGLLDDDEAAEQAMGEAASPGQGTSETRPATSEKESLAVRSGWRTGIALSLWAVASHLCFWYGQTQEGWSYLLEARVNGTVHLEINPDPLLRIAEDHHWQTPELQAALDLTKKYIFPDGYDHNISLGDVKVGPIEIKEYAQNFTYWGSVKGMWKEGWQESDAAEKHLHEWCHVTAICLVAFSLVWPHAKLLGLHVLWWTPAAPRTRSRGLKWLARFGKWSLMDALFVYCMMMMMSLQQYVDISEVPSILQRPTAVAEITRVFSGSPTLRTQAIAMAKKHIPISTIKAWATDKTKLCDALGLTGSIVKDVECQAAFTTFKMTVNNSHFESDYNTAFDLLLIPAAIDVAQHLEGTTGSVMLDVSVVGMWGIFAFCSGALLSLFLGTSIERFDHRHFGQVWETGSPAAAAELAEPAKSLSFFALRLPARVISVMSGITALVLVTLGILFKFMKRTYGGLAATSVANIMYGGDKDQIDIGGINSFGILDGIKLLRPTSTLNSGVEYDASFIIHKITFMIFCVGGPILFALFPSLSLFTPASSRQTRRNWSFGLSIMGDYCAWEVLVFAMILIQNQATGMTADLVMQLPPNDNGAYYTMCNELGEEDLGHVDLKPLPALWYGLLGGVLASTIQTAIVLWEKPRVVAAALPGPNPPSPKRGVSSLSRH